MPGEDSNQAWPEGPVDPATHTEQWEKISSAFHAAMQGHRLPENSAENLAKVYLPLARWIAARKLKETLIVGINGAQGSGKSTLCDFLRLILTDLHGQRVAVLSIDDLYRTYAEREVLARDVHPLLITRGVPGTHDVALGLEILARLRSASEEDLTRLPAFDKAYDDRRPEADWPEFTGRPDIVLLEGWCVGSTPQPATALLEPINALEQQDDADCRWRTFVNEQLSGEYRKFFAELDCLIFLRVPDMDRVLEWRSLQEEKLAAIAGNARHVMTKESIHRFVMHYERLTRHNLNDLQSRADLTLFLDENHNFYQVRTRIAPRDA